MKKIAVLMAAALSLGFLEGCRPKDLNAAGDWQLVYFEKDKIAQAIAISTLNVEKEADGGFSISGFSGVNNFYGKYISKGRNISAPAALSSTRMAGPSEAMEFESLFMRAMNAPSSWNVVQENGRPMLVIESGAEKSKMSFRLLGIYDAVWKLDFVNAGDAAVSVEIGDSVPSLEFSRSGTVSGTTGVNSISMDYEIRTEAHEIEIFPGAVTLSLAADGNAERLEREFLDALAKVRKYSVSGGTLNLIDGNGATLLTFQRQEFVLQALPKGRRNSFSAAVF